MEKNKLQNDDLADDTISIYLPVVVDLFIKVNLSVFAGAVSLASIAKACFFSL